jgi:ubiquitin carboxyl-terminal hydrolase 4/11/15
MAYAQIAGQEKVNELVKFPIEGLDMRQYVLELKDTLEPAVYDLYGVVDHYGNLNGGHYTASVKNFVNNRWYKMNDSSCSEIGNP